MGRRKPSPNKYALENKTNKTSLHRNNINNDKMVRV